MATKKSKDATQSRYARAFFLVVFDLFVPFVV
jgi:hypothetical protein